MNKKNSTKILSKRMQNVAIIGSIAGLLIGVILPVYLVSAGGPGETFGLWSTPLEKGILLFLMIIGIATQAAALAILHKWLKILPLVALILNALILFVAIFMS